MTVIEHVAALLASHVAVDLEAVSASLAILEASVNKVSEQTVNVIGKKNSKSSKRTPNCLIFCDKPV